MSRFLPALSRPSPVRLGLFRQISAVCRRYAAARLRLDLAA